MEKLAQEFHMLTGSTLSHQQMAALDIYHQELTAWNAIHNLTAIRDPEQVRVKHFLDSLSACLVMHGSQLDRVIDVGTGAGFPGLPLKILYPQMHLTLVESIGKRQPFASILSLNWVWSGLKSSRCAPKNWAGWEMHREQYDWAVARAVATLPVLLEYLLPLVRVDGRCWQ